MMFWIEFDLLFAFFYMQLITIVFWTVLDLIFILFCVQVIYMLFWGELDLIFTLSSLRLMRFWIDLIFGFFYMQVITDYHDVLD